MLGRFRMNLVEVWFGIVERQAIRRGVFKSVKDLNTKIRAFIDGWNDRAHPFVWTKTAEQVLAKANHPTTSNPRGSRSQCGCRRRSPPSDPERRWTAKRTLMTRLRRFGYWVSYRVEASLRPPIARRQARRAEQE